MLIAGIDEAGRGPVIGPMVMSIVLIDVKDNDKLKKIGVKDSKLLTMDKREFLYEKIKKIAKETYTIKTSAKEIDTLRKRYSLNFIELKITSKLINKLKEKPDYIYVDCPQISTDKYKNNLYALIDYDTKLIVENKADLNYLCVSAASIIAKVERDNCIKEYEKELNLELGCGYPHDEKTINALTKLEKLKPEIIRKSWQTYINLKNKEKQNKIV